MKKPHTLLALLLPALLAWNALSSTTASAGEKPEDNYRTYCAQCHGVQGNGKGINSRDMSVQPRDHTDTKEMSARSDQDLFKAIEDGGLSINKSVLMPPWDDVLSDEEITGLVMYLRTLCRCKHGE